MSSVDDPGWAGVAPQIAYADLVTGEAAFDFGPLAAGSYRLEVDGFELADEAVLAVPGPPTPARFQGQLRAPRSGGVPPVKRATPGARSGPEPRRGSD